MKKALTIAVLVIMGLTLIGRIANTPFQVTTADVNDVLHNDFPLITGN